MKYYIRRATVSLISAFASIGGLVIANNSVNSINESINNLDNGLLGGSSEEFAANLLGLAAGGTIFGALAATSIAFYLWAISAK